MLKANYTEEERKLFEHLRYHYPDTRIMKRFEVLWLHANEKSVSEIAPLVRQDPRTIRNVIKNYQEGGIELVSNIEYHQPTSELEKHRTSLIEEFTLRPPASAKEAAARIKKLFNIDRSPERVRVFMNRIGMKFRKVGALPAKADLDAQEEFKKKCWSLK